MKQEFRGMGIANIRDLNVSLVSSWEKRFNLDDHKLWKKNIQYKYLLVKRWMPLLFEKKGYVGVHNSEVWVPVDDW
jgi:hypothetical protein